MVNIAKKILLWVIAFILLLSSVSATFYPSDDIDLQGGHNITNVSFIYAENFCFSSNGTCVGIGNLDILVQEGDTLLIDWLIALLVLGVIVLVLGFKYEDYTITTLGSIFLMVAGVWMTTNGVGGVKNLVTTTFSMILLGVAAYVMIRGGYELYKEM